MLKIPQSVMFVVCAIELKSGLSDSGGDDKYNGCSLVKIHEIFPMPSLCK